MSSRWTEVSADQHVEWWAEHQRLEGDVQDLQAERDAGIDRGDYESARAAERKLDELWSQQFELRNSIFAEMPTTPEGAVIVAVATRAEIDIIHGYVDMTPEEIFRRMEGDAQAAWTLSRYVIANVPTDVLQRAGVDAVAMSTQIKPIMVQLDRWAELRVCLAGDQVGLSFEFAR